MAQAPILAPDRFGHFWKLPPTTSHDERAPVSDPSFVEVFREQHRAGGRRSGGSVKRRRIGSRSARYCAPRQPGSPPLPSETANLRVSRQPARRDVVSKRQIREGN